MNLLTSSFLNLPSTTPGKASYHIAITSTFRMVAVCTCTVKPTLFVLKIRNRKYVMCINHCVSRNIF